MSKTKMILVVSLALACAACGEKKDKASEAKDKAKEVQKEIADKAGGLLDRAANLKDKAETMKAQATAKLFDAAGTALRVKGEIEKVYKAAGDYDVRVSADGADDAGMKALEAQIAAMPHVTLGDLTIGYESMNEKTLDGTTYTSHFRATWVEHGQKIGLSYYTKEQIDLAAFAKLVAKFVPIVEAQLGFAG